MVGLADYEMAGKTAANGGPGPSLERQRTVRGEPPHPAAQGAVGTGAPGAGPPVPTQAHSTLRPRPILEPHEESAGLW